MPYFNWINELFTKVWAECRETARSSTNLPSGLGQEQAVIEPLGRTAV